MRPKLIGFALFALIAAALVGVLRLFNWAPTALQEGAFQRFSTVEEAKAHMNIAQVYLPAFYPQSVRWPPTLIGAQTRPYPAVLTEFTGREQPGVYLVITQTARRHPPLPERIKMKAVREQVRYPFKGRTAVLEVGICKDDEQCSSFAWDEGDYSIRLVMRSSPMELVRMAESMIPREPTPGEEEK
jgi:hypothetical protein